MKLNKKEKREFNRFIMSMRVALIAVAISFVTPIFSLYPPENPLFKVFIGAFLVFGASLLIFLALSLKNV